LEESSRDSFRDYHYKEHTTPPHLNRKLALRFEEASRKDRDGFQDFKLPFV
jgi:hypothetical protein